MFKQILSFIVLSLLLIGCANKNLSLENSEPIVFDINETNEWAKQTNIEEEDVDMSDIDETLTIDETVITQDPADIKIERMPFPTNEYITLERKGKGTVRGIIYLQDAYEKRILGAGTRLYLNPVTTYSKQWYKESYLGGYKMQKADTRLYNYLRFTASNSSGEFAFYGVPSGKYYLIGTVKCSTECGYVDEKNIRIATIVKVEGKEVLSKDLVHLID